MAVVLPNPPPRLRAVNWPEVKLPLVKLPGITPVPGVNPPVPVTALSSGSLITTSTRPTATSAMLAKASLLTNTCRAEENDLGL